MGMSYEDATAAIQNAMRGRAGRKECALRRHNKEQAIRDKEEKHRRAQERIVREAEEAEAMRLGTGFKKTIKKSVLLPPRPDEEARVTVQISISAVLALKASDMPPEKRQLLKDLFDLADDDGTGEIDASELGELLSKLGDRMTAAEVKAMMNTVDTDGSGTITLDELCVMIGPRLNDMEEVEDSADATGKMEIGIVAMEPSYGEIDVEVDEWELEEAEAEAAAAVAKQAGADAKYREQLSDAAKFAAEHRWRKVRSKATNMMQSLFKCKDKSGFRMAKLVEDLRKKAIEEAVQAAAEKAVEKFAVEEGLIAPAPVPALAAAVLVQV